MNRSDEPSPWWDKLKHSDRRPRLLTRARIKSALRAWFDAQGFIEIDAGCLQASPGGETHLHGFKTELVGTDLSRRDLYLHTSPEFAMKKLLAAGEGKIFAFAPVFRNRECGALHAPEFMMLEWYRAHAPYEALWTDCADILRIAAEVAGRADWSYRGRPSEATAQFDRQTVDQAFARYANVALRDASGGIVDLKTLAALARASGVNVRDDDAWSDIFSRVLVAEVEPKLGTPRPTILYAYPICEAALAQPREGDANVAERFELYVSGVELANGFGELTDAGLQRRRFEAWRTEKTRRYGEAAPIDEEFLAALDHMPPASGCALGFDRLVMLATGATRVEDVIWTPLDDRDRGPA